MGDRTLPETDLENQIAPAATSRPGVSLAAVTLGVVSLVLAVSTWAAWLFVRPEIQARMVSYYWPISVVFVLVLGALWFLALHGGVLAIVFGLVTGAHRADGGQQARTGALLGLLTLAVALAGTVVFITNMLLTNDLAPPPNLPIPTLTPLPTAE